MYIVNSINYNNYYKTCNKPIFNNKKLRFCNNVSFGGRTKAIKIAWLESLPNVTKSVKTQIKEFLPDTEKVHKKIFGISKTIVEVPNLSSNSAVTKDIMPVTYPHLLLFRPNDNIYALTEVVNKQDFISDYNATIDFLKKMYPQQDILFFEHGSGSLKYNDANKPKAAGKSVTFAHGHFCVMPLKSSNIFSDLVKEVKNILSYNNWSNIDDNSIKTLSISDGYKKLINDENIGNSYPPYLAMSYFDHIANKEKSLIILQDNDKATTPSQLLRMLANKFAFNDNNEANWNYKKLLIKVNNGENYNEFNLKIKEVKKQDKLFENRINEVLKRM